MSVGDKRLQRVSEFKRLGINVQTGPWLGSLIVVAGEADKILRRLRSAERAAKAKKRAEP